MPCEDSREQKKSGNRMALWFLVLILGLVFFFYLTTLSDQLGSLGGDNARYLLLADALRDGKGYVETERPGSPRHTMYPPLFPVLLAPLRAIEPDGYRLPHLLIVISALVAVAGFFFLLRQTFGSLWALLGAALLGLLPVTARSLLPILSELPFLALTLWSLVFWEKHNRREGGVSFPLILSCLFASAAFLTRTAGIVLVATLVLGAVIRWPFHLGKPLSFMKRTLALGTVLAILVPPAIGWFLWTHQEGAHHFGYVKQLFSLNPYQPDLGNADALDIANRALERTSMYLMQVPQIYLEGLDLGKTKRILGGLILGVLFLLGAGRCIFRPRLWHGYLLLYLTQILVWPWGGERFLLPVLPLLTGILLGGGVVLHKVLPCCMPRPAAAAVAALPITILILGCIPGWIKFYRVTTRQLEYHGSRSAEYTLDFSSFYEAQQWSKGGIARVRLAVQAWGDYLAMGRMIAANPRIVMVSCRKPRLLALTAGIKAEGLPAPAPPEKYLQRFRRRNIEYIISLRKSFQPDAAQRAINAMRKRYPEIIRTEYSLENVELLRVGSAPGKNGPAISVQ